MKSIIADSLTSSKMLLFLCLAFIAGIFLASVFQFSNLVIYIILFLGVFLISIGSFSKGIPVIFGFCILIFVIGILRLQIANFNVSENQLIKLHGEEIIIEGVINEEPDLRDNSQLLKVKTKKGVIMVVTKRFPEYEYLDNVKLQGKIEEPFENEEFSYKNYLLADHIYSVMSFPAIESTGKSSGNFFTKVNETILAIKQKARESIETYYLPPQSSVLRAMILGDKGAISKEFKEKLSIAGLSHIVAISGMHIVIITQIIISLLIFAGLWRHQAFWVTVIFICFYVALVGFPASGVRASLMGFAYLVAQYFGRQSMSSRIVFIVASIMLIFNPFLLFYNVGFQLSFLAVLGLVYLNSSLQLSFTYVIKRFLKVKVENYYQNILFMFSATLSAQVFTLPIIIYNFGNFAFLSPLANILVLPLIPFVMIFGFLSVFSGMIFQPLGFILALPENAMLSYFVFVVKLLSGYWAHLTFSDISWWWLILSYAVIFYVTVKLEKKCRRFIV